MTAAFDDDDLAGLSVVDLEDDLDADHDLDTHKRSTRRDPAAVWQDDEASTYGEWQAASGFDAEKQTYANGKVYVIEPRPVRYEDRA